MSRIFLIGSWWRNHTKHYWELSYWNSRFVKLDNTFCRFCIFKIPTEKQQNRLIVHGIVLLKQKGVNWTLDAKYQTTGFELWNRDLSFSIELSSISACRGSHAKKNIAFLYSSWRKWSSTETLLKDMNHVFLWECEFKHSTEKPNII